MRASFFLLAWLWVAMPCIAADFTFHHEDVLGTSLRLTVRAETRVEAENAEAAALRELDRLAAIYSTYDAGSELTRFGGLPVGEQMRISPELFELLRLSDAWTAASDGAFNPAVELLSRTWRDAERQQVVPSSNTLTAQVAEIAKRHWQLDGVERTARRLSPIPLTFNAIAKGMILDRVGEKVLEMAGVRGVLIEIGGDLRVLGDAEAAVAVADPRRDALGAVPLTQLRVRSGAVATSGGSERFQTIAGRKFSHLIDPRRGTPVSHTISATVLAADASTADVLATVCSVLSVEESLQLVERLPHVECLLVAADGTLFTSAAWPGPASAESSSAEPAEVGADEKSAAAQAERSVEPAKKSDHEFLVEFQISKPENAGRRYRRPYVAVWVEDDKGFPVKTLSLFLMKDNPGPRWHRDLRRWYSNDRTRRLYDDRNLIETVSKPTRNPGQYKVAWDGTDDAKQPVAPGKYTLLIEAAREHGTYQLLRHNFEFGGPPFAEKLPGNVEISAASIEYKRAK